MSDGKIYYDRKSELIIAERVLPCLLSLVIKLFKSMDVD